MNENYYYWEDRFLDVLRKNDPGSVWERDRWLRDQFIRAVSPALRFAVVLDRPDMIAPVLPDREGRPSLADVTWENEELVRILCSHGARERFGDTPLINLIRDSEYDDDYSHLHVWSRVQLYRLPFGLLDYIVRHGPFLECPDGYDPHVWLPELEAVLETGVIARDPVGKVWRSALQNAIWSGKLEAVRAFLRHGVDPNMSLFGRPLAFSALSSSHPKIYDLLIAAGAKLEWNAGGSEGPALWYAIRTGMVEAVRAMLAQAMEAGTITVEKLISYFEEGVKIKNIEMARLFLDAGMQICRTSREQFLNRCAAFTVAAVHVDILMLSFLLANGASEGEVIFNAALYNDREILSWALERGIGIDTPNLDGKTVLMVAVTPYSGKVDGRFLDLVLSHKPNINYVSHDGSTALSLAINAPDAVKLLLGAGADVNGAFGRTPLMNAADFGNMESVKLLLAAGADVNAALDDGGTAWHIANRHGHEDIATLLEAARACEPDISRTSLQAAIRWGRTADALRLIDEGADIEKRDSQGRTPLMAAMVDGCDEAVVLRLIERGANPNCSIGGDGDYHSPLSLAIDWIRPDLVRYLLHHGANAEGDDDYLPLNEAVFIVTQRYKQAEHPDIDRAAALDILRQLLEAGASPNAHGDIDYIVPLGIAASENDIEVLQLLVDHGADLELRSQFDNQEGHTALLDACCAPQVEAVQYLLERGANPNTVSDYWRIPLYSACQSIFWDKKHHEHLLSGVPAQDFAEVQDWDERSYQIVKLLLNYGADVTLKQDKGWNSILRQARTMVILTKPRCEMIRMLIDAGAVD